jgi:hypothetical protein
MIQQDAQIKLLLRYGVTFSNNTTIYALVVIKVMHISSCETTSHQLKVATPGIHAQLYTGLEVGWDEAGWHPGSF